MLTGVCVGDEVVLGGPLRDVGAKDTVGRVDGAEEV